MGKLPVYLLLGFCSGFGESLQFSWPEAGSIWNGHILATAFFKPIVLHPGSPLIPGRQLPAIPGRHMWVMRVKLISSLIHKIYYISKGKRNTNRSQDHRNGLKIASLYP